MEEIIAVAEEQRATLIALATHGYSGLKRWTLGSVTDKVVHAATEPVFIIRSDAQPPADDIAFERILVPLDGSLLAKQALPFATDLATRAQAELTLIEAISPVIESYPIPLGQPMTHYSVLLPALRAKATDDLASAAHALCEHDIAVKTLVADGYPAELIVDTADTQASDLIIMATHGYGGIRRWALGSVADKVLHAATTPLVLVRAQSAS